MDDEEFNPNEWLPPNELKFCAFCEREAVGEVGAFNKVKNVDFKVSVCEVHFKSWMRRGLELKLQGRLL